MKTRGKKTPDSKMNQEPTFFDGWPGHLPTKPLPKNYDSQSLVENPNEEHLNKEYHDHGPRDKCDENCRSFQSQNSTSSSHAMKTRSKTK